MTTTCRILFALSLFLTGCSAGTILPHAETLPAAEGPARIMDTTIRLNDRQALEIFDSGLWKPLEAKGLPSRVVYPEPAPQPRPLTAFSMGFGDLMGAATPLEIYQSKDRGMNWSLLIKREIFGNYAYFTALGLSPRDPKILAVGTSFHGLHESRDGGKTWTNISKPFDNLAAGAGYYELINAIAYSQIEPETIYVSVGINGSLFKVNSKTLKAQRLTFPGERPLTMIDGLLTYLEGEQEILEARTREGYWRWETGSNTWFELGERPISLEADHDPAKLSRMEASKDKFGLYLTSFQASDPKKLMNHITFAKDSGLNALVIDFKEDTGVVAYKSGIELAQKARAIQNRLDVPALVSTVHEQGLYLIARVVVFKDEKLYNYAGNKYALWDNTTKKPWAYLKKFVNAETNEETFEQKEFWVDTYSQDVWNYNLALAKELESLGIDEIQFDYIRFPSDGPVQNITHRFRIIGMSRMDALESFLKQARSMLTIPISVDIFGFNGYFTMDYLGQNMEILSQYVDAISPMFYPSHFAASFLPKTPFMDRAYQIYQDGSNRTYMATRGRVHVRPWVQAFLIGSETKFDVKTYSDYLHNQLNGVKASQAKGFLLWNASNKYYMVTKPLKDYTQTEVVPVSIVSEAVEAPLEQVPAAP